MHALTALWGWACNILHGVPRGSKYKESIGATEDRFGERSLTTGYHNQLKILTQDNGESLQKFATTIEQLTHHAFPALHEDHVLRGACYAFGNGIRDQGIRHSTGTSERSKGWKS
jgi:hypothetical protein